ncbi:hypothetical protein AK812_SmicGene38208 [Symbiodinium microadriaticum]|uniref:Uncharacterized protein n=1 Tax=Symbiodinium microadriaticum TaxID=2951 RepID=A0A1Q9CEF5_SYMMI|nr:hypothetical protein AK812_SmicGene38208 [Symbiodinium microadriaticum]CAE7363065.1 unnamed protein product [Symbiodinium sp. KB8]CAE7492322.1 unnamed protein product [Symbiodinium microadriaticum]
MKQSLGVAAVLFLWLLAAEGAKVRSLEALVGEALQQSFHNEDKKSFRLSEQEIEWMLSQSREGGNGQSRLEVQRVRRKDPVTGEEFDDVFVNETWTDPDEEGRSICQEEGDGNFTPSTELVQTAQKLLDSEYGALVSTAIAAYVSLAEYFGQELYHMEAKVGSPEPIEEPHGQVLVEISEEWNVELNRLLTAQGRDACENSPEWLLFCMKQTTCLLEDAVTSDPKVFTAGRMATYLEVEKEVHDHYEEFAILAKLGLPHMPPLCSGEQEVAREGAPTPGALLQLKAEVEETSGTSARRSEAVAAVVQLHRAAQRTELALKNHANLADLELSFFTHTWKKTCEMIGCNVESFTDILDASIGHTAELVDVQASWHAVKTHHRSFVQLKTSVFGAMNGSTAFHENFASFIYRPGKSKGQRRTDPMFKEASDVLSTALALKQRNNEDGKPIAKSGWWCWSWRVTATGGYAKKFPDKTSTWGVATGFKLLSGSTLDLATLMSQNDPGYNFKTSVALTIGYVPDMPGVAGVRAGVSVGGTLSLGPGKIEIKITLGLGMSAAVDAKWTNNMLCGGPEVIGVAPWDFKCRGSVAAAFTLFCKKLNFLDGSNGATMDDPCSTWNKFYKQNNGDADMPGQGRSHEKNADACRERCKTVRGCQHYSFWKDGGCHLQNWDSHRKWKRNSGIMTGPPVCCARPSSSIKKDMSGQGRSGEAEYMGCWNRCKRVKGCRYFTYYGKDGGCHLGDRNVGIDHNSGQGGRIVTADAYCMDEALKQHNVVGLFNKEHKRFIRVTGDRHVDASGRRNDGTLPGDWEWEKFTVVEANWGQVGLYCTHLNRFLMMKDDGSMGVSEWRKVDQLWDGDSWMLFRPVEAGDGYFAFHNEAHNRYIRTNPDRVVDASNPKGRDDLPDWWGQERYKIVDV